MYHRFLWRVGAYCLLSRQLRIGRTQLAVTAAGKMERQLRQLVGVRVIELQLQSAADQRVQAGATGRTHFVVEAGANRITAEGEGPGLLRSNQAGLPSFLQMLLDRLSILVGHLGKQSNVKCATDDRRCVQQYNDLRSSLLMRWRTALTMLEGSMASTGSPRRTPLSSCVMTPVSSHPQSNSSAKKGLPSLWVASRRLNAASTGAPRVLVAKVLRSVSVREPGAMVVSCRRRLSSVNARSKAGRCVTSPSQ